MSIGPPRKTGADMAMGFILVFVALPILEIVLFIRIGGEIGLLPTLAIILFTGVAGVAIMRWQGMRALDRLRASIDTGDDPVGPIAHSALILVAGLLLLLPGFFADFLGLLLLLRPVRRLLIRRGASRVTVRAAGYVRRSGHPQAHGPGPGQRPPETIDADYEVVDEAQPQGSSGWTRPH